MSRKLLIGLASILFVLCSAYFISCSKPDPAPPVVTDPCANKTIVVSGVVTPAANATSATGAIAASATGSSGYTFSINGGAFQASGNFTSLAVGSYTIAAKDGVGCTGTTTITVTAAPCPTIDITAVLTQATNATAANGAINATASGSTGFTYSLAGGAFQASGNFTALVANTYQITAKDLNGCTFTKGFTVTAASCPTITVSSTTVPAAGPTATNGSITASGSGGLAPYTYSLNSGTFQTSGTFSSLLASGGTVNYSIVAKDANNCLSASTPVTVSFTPCPTINITTVLVGSEFCAPTNVGSVTINASGSTGFTYNLNGGTYQASNLFGGLAANNYTVGVKDANGCEKTAVATVGVLAQGPLFTNVKAVLATNCALSGCHAGAAPQNGINFTDNCTIVAQKIRINARAVVAGTMPPSGAISAADKQKITDWINAGGKFSN